jgi:hypothetical protein
VRWYSEGEIDVRQDPHIGEQILAFLKPHAPGSTVLADVIIPMSSPNRTRMFGLRGMTVVFGMIDGDLSCLKFGVQS